MFSAVIINDASDKKSSVQLTNTHKILAPDLIFLQQVGICSLLHPQLQN